MRSWKKHLVVSGAALVVFSCTEPSAQDDTRPPENQGDAGLEGGPLDAGGKLPDADSCDVEGPFGAPVLLAELNSDANDSFARLSMDELAVIFSSDRGTGESRFFTAKRAALSNPFEAPGEVPNVPAPGTRGVSPTLSSDGTLLIFEQSTESGAPVIAIAYRVGSGFPFGAPAELAAVASAGGNVAPYLAADDSRFYFASSRSQSERLEIYESMKPDGGSSFGEPLPVPGIASDAGPGGDTAPVISADRKTLYFASRRDDADYHVYVARRNDPSEPFAAIKPVTELNSPLGSGIAEYPTAVSADGCRLYLTRGTPGSLDLYVASRAR